MSRNDLAQSFQKYFQVILADTPELRNEVYRIRYQVYCEELQYEPVANFPDGLERDLYDEHSYHCLLLHRPSKQYAGCVRLVLNDPDNLQAILPFETHCGDNLYGSMIKPILQDRSKFGEISRLAVPAVFRKRKEDIGSLIGEVVDPSVMQQGQRKFTYIPLGMYLAAAAAGLEMGMNGVFAMMEPRLVRHLQRFGIVFQQVGDIIEYRGQRAAYYISREGLYKNLTAPVKNLLHLILSDISTALKTGT